MAQDKVTVTARLSGSVGSEVARRSRSGGLSRSAVIERDLGRYYFMVSYALAEVRENFSSAELSLISDALSMVPAEPATMATAVEYAARVGRLRDKWSVDPSTVASKLESASLLHRSALLDSIEALA